MRSAWLLSAAIGMAAADNCPFGMGGGSMGGANTMSSLAEPQAYLPVYRNDSGDVYMTTDWGTPIQDLVSLKVGSRGPTLLEDFMFRQKLQHFDHERVSRIVL